MFQVDGEPAQPRFVALPDVRHKFFGARPRGLEGAVVHFDAGRTRPTRGAGDPDWGARNTLRLGQASGFAYATIGRGGTIYLPSNMDWTAWGSHAGKSRCPATGRTAVSRFYVGFELNAPGWVLPTRDPDLFVPWYEAVRDASGRVILDKGGRASPRDANGELYRRDELRIVTARHGNIRKAAYVPFTNAQMEALVAALCWLNALYSKTFSLNRVFGHDELAFPRGRKLDPGGCLGWEGQGPLTMAAFRAHLVGRSVAGETP